ncbi:MAG: hypothetical protein LBS70_07835, partial [Candidatus Accumulibacter sp.]|nr:hypothetical protein [Accumulibacter sp.]
MRRFAPEIHDSGFRVEPVMTRFVVFAGRGPWHRPAGSVGAICDRPSACAGHAYRRANTVRPYDGKHRPAIQTTLGAPIDFFTFHVSPFTFRIPHSIFMFPALHAEKYDRRTASALRKLRSAQASGRTQFAPALKKTPGEMETMLGAPFGFLTFHISPFTFHGFHPSPFPSSHGINPNPR